MLAKDDVTGKRSQRRHLRFTAAPRPICVTGLFGYRLLSGRRQTEHLIAYLAIARFETVDHLAAIGIEVEDVLEEPHVVTDGIDGIHQRSE